MPPVPPVAPPPGPESYHVPRPAGIPVPPAAAPRRSRAWIVFAVLGVVLVAIVAVLIITLSSVLGTLSQGSDAPTPTPAAECELCISEVQARELRPSDAALGELGLSLYPDYTFAKPSNAGTYADSSQRLYSDGLGAPEGCWALLDYSPVSATHPGTEHRTDRVMDLGSYGDDENTVSQVVRVFSSVTAADDYPQSIRDTITDCPRYAVSFEDGGRWDADVVPTTLDLAAVEGATGVTAVGWDERDGDWIVTAVDLQYRNIAIRTVFSHPAGGGPGAEQFTAFLAATARAMATIP